MFVPTQLLNELSLKVPVAQVLKEIERSSNPEQPGHSSTIRLEAVCACKPNLQFCMSFFSPPLSIKLLGVFRGPMSNRLYMKLINVTSINVMISQSGIRHYEPTQSAKTCFTFITLVWKSARMQYA